MLYYRFKICLILSAKAQMKKIKGRFSVAEEAPPATVRILHFSLLGKTPTKMHQSIQTQPGSIFKLFKSTTVPKHTINGCVLRTLTHRFYMKRPRTHRDLRSLPALLGDRHRLSTWILLFFLSECMS